MNNVFSLEQHNIWIDLISICLELVILFMMIIILSSTKYFYLLDKYIFFGMISDLYNFIMLRICIFLMKDIKIICFFTSVSTSYSSFYRVHGG